MEVETVEIVCDNETGFKVINKSDLSKNDTLYVAKEVKASKKQTKAKK